MAINKKQLPAVVYEKPAHLYTRKDAALLNARVVGAKVAQLHYLMEYPTRYSNCTPLPRDEVVALRAALRSSRPLTTDQSRQLAVAMRAGQVIRSNLYAATESFDVKPPTLGEAAAYLQAHLTDGSLPSWIVEYYHRGKGHKCVWTVGDSIHADDRRYVPFDLWGNHFKAKSRDQYQAQGVRYDAGRTYTRWIAADVDNHGGEQISLAEWLARYTALHDLFVAEGLPYLAQVNPRNSSYQLWSPVPKWAMSRVLAFADRITATCPWVREVYPTKTKWAIICPLRPDKVNLLGAGELAKVKCRTKTRCYDLVAAWRWHRNPTGIDPDAVRTVLTRSFASPAAIPTTAPAPATPNPPAPATPTKLSRTPPAKKSPVPNPKGTVDHLKGRWLELLSDTYLDGVEPPVGSIVSFLTPQLRLFRAGETEAARTFLSDVIEFMRARGWTFSDRLQNNPAELLRTLDHICQDRAAATDPTELLKLDSTRTRLDALGFTGTFASLLSALAARRASGRSSGVIDRPVKETEEITAVALRLAKMNRTDHQSALDLLRRVLNYIDQRSELAYSLLKEIGHQMGVRLTNYKAQTVFTLLLKHKLIMKVRNYSHCREWSIGNQYATTDQVVFDTNVVDQSKPTPTGGQDLNVTILSPGFGQLHLIEPLDMDEIAREVAQLRADKRMATRIRSQVKPV